MGLDMYLTKMPRYKNATPKDVVIVENFLDYIRNQLEGNHCTFHEWCHTKLSEVNLEFVEFYSKYYTGKYSPWDTEKKYPWYRIDEQVGYWRKANQIHNWIVNNVQDGVDDCGTYEVTKDKLEELLEVCEYVKKIAILEDGKVTNGATLENGKWVDNYVDGKVIVNQGVIKALLPTTSGFFFGHTDYDDYYMEDVDNTIEILEKVLSETDFEKEMISYHSSW